MQVQDIADFNSQYFNYMVGSEAKVGGEGFVYDQWLEKLYDGCGTEEVLIEICDSYVASEGLNQYHMTFHRTIYIGTMSVLDLSKVEEYRIALEEFAASIHLSLITNFPKVSQFLVSHDSFALGKYCTIDVVYFLRALTKMSEFATFHNQAENVISHLMNLVKYNGVQPDAINYAFGLAAHFCTEERTTKYDLSETRFVNWRSLFAAYVLVE